MRTQNTSRTPTRVLLVLSAALLLVTAFAQQTLAQPPTSPALESILRFEGRWSGQATLVLEGKTFQFAYHADFKKTSDGKGLYMEEWFTSPELGEMKGSNLIGFNANDGKIHWFSVDNFGTTHDHLGTWKTADHFAMQTTEMQGGKKFVEKIDMKVRSNELMDLTLVGTLGGKEFEKLSVTFHREAMSSRP